jgi:predicted Zn-dependent protease
MTLLWVIAGLPGMPGLAAAAPAATRPASAEEHEALSAAAHDIELRIQRGGRLYGHPELDGYLQAVAEKLLAAEPTPPPEPIRVHVVKDESANAFALPNGGIYVTTQLLCILDSEAELASILGHELTHYTNAHALREQRSNNHKSAFARGAGAVLGILVAVAGARSGVNTGDAVQLPQQALDLWVMASVSGYSRDLEREADHEGLRRMVAAGYDADEAVKAFEQLKTAAPEDAKESSPMFASHPKLEDRIASLRELAGGEPASGVAAQRFVGRDEYQRAIAGLGLDQVEVLMNASKLDPADALVRVVAARADSARVAYLEGEVARRRTPRSGETEARALAAYTRATTLPDPPAAAFREQGILYRLRGDRGAAVAAFHAYLERAPQAADVPLVRLYLEALAKDDAAQPPEGSKP